MIQLVASGSNGEVFLDLYEQDPLKLTISIEDIVTTDTTTAFSREFRVPATDKNYEFFKTAFSVNGYDFDITEKKAARLLVDGAEYTTGEIRLQKIYDSVSQNKIDYGVIFLGPVRNFASSLGDSTLCQLDLTALSHIKNLANVTASWDAYPETAASLDGGLLSGSIIYPLVDFGNTYTGVDFTPEQTRVARGSGIHFTQAGYPLEVDYLRPCIKVKDVWDKIFENAGFTYTSEFLESNLFRHLYVGAWGSEAVVTLDALSNTARFDGTRILGAGNIVVPLNGFSGPDYWNINSEFPNGYIAPESGNTEFTVKIDLSTQYGQGGGNFTLTPRLYQLGVGAPIHVFDNVTFESIPGGISSYDTLVLNHIENLTAGETYYLALQITAQTNQEVTIITGVKWDAGTTPEANPAAGLDCEFKQTDFIKDIVTKFRLTLSPDKDNPTNFIIEPWQDYIASGELFNWTSKLDTSKDIVIEPLFFKQKDRIEFTDKEGKDYLNEANLDEFDEVYGALNVDANNELLKDKREIKTNLTPVPAKQIEGAAEVAGGMDNTIIPQIHTHEAEIKETSGLPVILHKPVIPGIRLFWYDGLKHTGTTSARDNNWYITDGIDTDDFTKFPMISQFNEWGDRDDSWQGLDTQTLDLSWQREQTYIEFDLASPNEGISVYDRYWRTYIDTLYNKWSRKLSAYFILNQDDLQNFSFDDVIFIKDAYFYVEKIYDVPIGNRASVKVDLIKLNNYQPPVGGFVPVGEYWEDIAQNWEAIATLWEQL